MVFLFALLVSIAVFFVFGFFVAVFDGGFSNSFSLLIFAAIFAIPSIGVPRDFKYIPIKNPEIVFNSTGAIVTTEGKNYFLIEYAEVEGLKNGTATLLRKNTYNFYGFLIDSAVVTR